MTRIKQFANDMGLSYNKAKKLVNKGRRLKDGGSSTLEKFMPVKAQKGKITKIDPKGKNLDRAKFGQFNNIIESSKKGLITPEEAQKRIRKLILAKQRGGGFDLDKEIKKIEALDKTPGGKATKELMLKMIKDSKKKPIKKANGGLKPIPDDNPGLKALKRERPDVVAKMGFKKKGGTLSFEMGGMNDMEDGNYMAKIESLQIVPTEKKIMGSPGSRPRPGRAQRGPVRGGVPSRKRRSMKEMSMKRPKRMSGGGVARGTGAAVKGTGFKGVY
jgi:hypothetical protein